MRKAKKQSSLIVIPRRARPGFTFIEVMFAVLILGFGVIMIAAMLPVAIRETQRARETSAGTAVCETGFHSVATHYAVADSVTQAAYLPPTGSITSAGGFVTLLPRTYPSWAPGDEYVVQSDPLLPTTTPVPLFHATLGSRVDSVRRDTAYIPFYQRTGALAPKLAILGVRVRNALQMQQSPSSLDLTDPPNYLLPGQFFTSHDNCPLPVSVMVVPVPGAAAYYDNVTQTNGVVEKLEPDHVQLGDPLGGNVADLEERLREAAVEAAALVLVNDSGRIRVLRLGKPAEDDSTGLIWTLATGGDVKVTYNPNAAAGSQFTAEFTPGEVYHGYLVGRMLKDPNKPWVDESNEYVGPSQVVQALESKTIR